MANHDITEEFQLNLSLTPTVNTFELTNTAYDVVIDSLPFIAKVSKEIPYRRETAQYKKDQFDSAVEPGEQSLSGWWLRSQSSWHNGSGIRYFEPGTDAAHVTHRFYTSRGIDIWTPGQATLLNDVHYSHTGANGIVSTATNDGVTIAGVSNGDVLIAGDSAGVLNKIKFRKDTTATTTPYTLYTTGVTHNSAYPFLSVTDDGGRYYAVCATAIHSGDISGSDSVIYHLGSTVTNAVIKYVKGYLLYGSGRYLAQIKSDNTTSTGHNGSSDLPSGTGGNFINHLSTTWKWNSITGGGNVVYASGYNNSRSEIWAIPYSDTTVNLSLPDARVVAEMPSGERINKIYYYLGYIVIATNKGVRIATVDQSGYQAGNITYGPILIDTDYEVKDITAYDKFAWVATAVKGTDGVANACLIRIDLSTPFDDGTFPYAYDIEYNATDPSYGEGVHYANNTLHLVLNEGSSAGEIQSQHSTNKRATGWIETGFIRYATSQPKYFKYIDVAGSMENNSSITIQSIDSDLTNYNIINLTSGSIGDSVEIRYPQTKEVVLAFKFTLNASTDLLTSPKLDSYQVKSIPAVTRQRLIQYPLSCYDIEMDRFNIQFGYIGRAYSVMQQLEELENNSNFVTVTDYRTNEKYTGVIEEVRFTNESSADKNNNGYGGVLLVTVRKI